MSRDTIKAFVFAAAAFFLFSVVDVFAKWMAQRYDPCVVLLFCAGAGLIMIAPFVLTHKGIRGFVPRQPVKYHVWRAIQTSLNGFLIVTALRSIPMADYYGIVFAAPFVTTIFSVLFLKEHVGVHRWAAIVAGFAGIWVIVMPAYHDFNMGTLAALFVPVTLAFNAILLRKIGKDEYLPLFPFYSFLGLVILNLPLVFGLGMKLPEMQHLWLFFPYSAAVIVAIALLARAIAFSPVMASTSSMQYTSLVWGSLFGYFIFHETPSPNTWIGAVIIIAAGLYMFHRERLHARGAASSAA